MNQNIPLTIPPMFASDDGGYGVYNETTNTSFALTSFQQQQEWKLNEQFYYEQLLLSLIASDSQWNGYPFRLHLPPHRQPSPIYCLYRDRLLQACDQLTPHNFTQAFSVFRFVCFQHLDSGSYSEVVAALFKVPKPTPYSPDLMDHWTGQHKLLPVVFKVIKLQMSDQAERGSTHYSEVFQEVSIMKLLSCLHAGFVGKFGYRYQTHGFARMYKSHVISGPMPDYFPAQNARSNPNTANECLVMVMRNGGTSLWEQLRDPLHRGRQQQQPQQQQRPLNISEIYSVIFQVVSALAVAESAVAFEHRDLHLSNIVVRRTDKTEVTYVWRSRTYRILTMGVKATIIDATFSRAEDRRRNVWPPPNVRSTPIYYTDLTTRLEDAELTAAAAAEPTSQTAVYVQMSRLVGRHRWVQWFPETNLHWIRFVLSQVFTSEAFTSQAGPAEHTQWRDMIAALEKHHTVAQFMVTLVSSFNRLVAPHYNCVQPDFCNLNSNLFRPWVKSCNSQWIPMVQQVDYN